MVRSVTFCACAGSCLVASGAGCDSNPGVGDIAGAAFDPGATGAALGREAAGGVCARATVIQKNVMSSRHNSDLLVKDRSIRQAVPLNGIAYTTGFGGSPNSARSGQSDTKVDEFVAEKWASRQPHRSPTKNGGNLTPNVLARRWRETHNTLSQRRDRAARRFAPCPADSSPLIAFDHGYFLNRTWLTVIDLA